MKSYLKFIAVGLAALSVGSVLGTAPAQAKRKAATIVSWESEGWEEQYVVTKGAIYKNYRLTKKLKTKQRIFWSDLKFTVKKTNGKRVTYRELQKKSGHFVGYVVAKNVKKLKDSDPRSDAYKSEAKTKTNLKKKNAAKAKVAEKKAFTASERAQIAAYRKQFKQISNTTKGMYDQKPSVKKTFTPGKLSAKYIDATVDSINFYREMFGLRKVSADASWNTDAQYGAATLAAANKGLSHGLVGLTKPGFVSAADWKHGAEATNTSNLSEGLTKPYDNILTYVNDGNNISGEIPGHREWVLGGITKVGVGQAGAYNDLNVFGGAGSGESPDTVAFPKAGVFPMSAADSTVWSVSFAHQMWSNAPAPTVKVVDNTTHKIVKVTKVGISSDSYGEFGTTVYYKPAASQIKLNHAYTITVKNIVHQADVSYQTKLFDLKD